MPNDIFVGNVYNFDVIYNVHPFISDFSKHKYLDISPRSVTVTVKYSYTPDMDAAAVEMTVALDSLNALTPIPRNELGYPYVLTYFC